MGDRALLVELGDEIDRLVNRKVRELFLKIEKEKIQGIKDLVPTYRSLMVVYDPLAIPMVGLESAIRDLWTSADSSNLPRPKILRVPVVYGGKRGPDLEWVASYHHLAPEEVINLHTQPTYQVYMIGFTPGYPYMGEVPEAISTPRRETPRTVVPQGSVAIAQRQTGIYPVQSPGGWHILGWTPLRLFDAGKWPPSLLEMGDLVRFLAIREDEITQWQE
jgi:KipI family sensor histidine kinase inhibitor